MSETDRSPDDDGRGPLERTVEVFVYAPIGALLEAHRLFPQAVDRGRREVGGLVDWLGRRVRGAHGEATAGLRGLARQDPDAPAPRPPVAADPPAVAPERSSRSDGPAPIRAVPRPERAAGGDQPPVDELAIPDYDSLSASQVVPRLTGLGSHELEQVRRYEAGGRGRRTILSRIAQLQQG